MKVSFIALVSLVGIFATSVARAQVTWDIGKITCSQYLGGHVTDSRTLGVWLSGYYQGTQQNTVLDVSALQKKARELMDYCLSHSDAIVLDAAQKVLGSGK